MRAVLRPSKAAGATASRGRPAEGREPWDGAERGERAPASATQRWLARLSFVLAGLAIATVAAVAGLKSIAMLAVGLGGAAVRLAGAFAFLSNRGMRRWLSLAALVLAPIAVLCVYAFASLLWVAIVSAAAWLLAGLTARAALTTRGATDWRACPRARWSGPPLTRS